MGAVTRLLSIICSVTDYDCIPDAAAEQQPFALLAAGSNTAGVANEFKHLSYILNCYSDKRAVAHSDKLSTFCSRSARRFLAPASTCFMVRLA
jgi:hypothetical protein